MTKSTITRERLQEIAEDGFLKHGESKELARMALAAMESEPVATLDVQSRRPDGNKFALVFSSAAHKLPDDVYFLYRYAQPAPVVPENCVTAEHRRVIEMLLNVCGAAFELADDSCQQDVDGEDCHVVPDDAFQKLSDALDEIENTLPTEDIDRPDVFLAWSAMPRAALKSLLQAQPVPVVSADLLHTAASAIEDLLEHTDPNTSYYSGVWADVPGKLRAAMFQAKSLTGNSPVIGIDLASGPDRTVEVHYVAPPGYVMVPKEPTKEMIDAGWLHYMGTKNPSSKGTYKAMLAAAPQSPRSEPATVPGKWIPVSEKLPERGDYLVSDGRDFDVQLFNGEQFIPGFVWEDKITHWMPLPATPQEVK